MSLEAARFYDVIEGTWPPARRWAAGPWMFRDGAGGGKRVSAATARGPEAVDDIDAAEAEMRARGQRPLFMLRAGDAALDAALAARGYRGIDETAMFDAPIGLLTDKPIPRVTCFAIWEPLAIMRDIWARAGVGPARLEVMGRAACKTAIFARWNEKPAGVGFVAVHEGAAMVHAVEVLPHQRRQGVADWIMRAAALWAQKEAGAERITLLCVTQNAPATALYRKLGFAEVGRYHYRQAPE